MQSFSWDEGACYAPKEIWNSMMLVHWGNTNSKHNHSTTAYWADNWDKISPDRRGDHPCFDPDKDLVLPAWKSPNLDSLKLKLWSWYVLCEPQSWLHNYFDCQINICTFLY